MLSAFIVKLQFLINKSVSNIWMIAVRREMESDDQRAQEPGLTPEEIAFYDVVTANIRFIPSGLLGWIWIINLIRQLRKPPPFFVP